jgi:hypothetical protein
MSPLASLKRLLVHRVTVVALTLSLAAGLVLAHATSTLPAALDEPTLAHFLSLDGLDHLLVSIPFGLLVAAFLASLLLSSWDQLRLATRQPHPLLDRRGWRRWGGALLHLGLALSLISFLHYVLTERQGFLTLTEGEEVPAGAPWAFQVAGLLAAPFPLPAGVRLARVEPVFRADDTLRALSATVELRDGASPPERASVSPNRSHDRWDFRLFQLGAFGHAFFLEVPDGAGGSGGIELRLPIPRSRDTAGYGVFRQPPFAETLKVKYHLDHDRASMEDSWPLLVMRLVDGDVVRAELALHLGEEGMLGPHRVRLVAVRRWTSLLFDAGPGLSPVLLGFALLSLGAVMIYSARVA